MMLNYVAPSLVSFLLVPYADLFGPIIHHIVSFLLVLSYVAPSFIIGPTSSAIYTTSSATYTTSSATPSSTATNPILPSIAGVAQQTNSDQSKTVVVGVVLGSGIVMLLVVIVVLVLYIIIHRYVHVN